MSEEDQDQVRIEKRAFVLAAALYGLLGIVWGSFYLALGLALPAFIPHGYVVFAALVLGLLASTGWFGLARTAILVSWLLLPPTLTACAGRFRVRRVGDPVNTASRMESHGVPGHIQVTSRVYERLRDSFHLEERGVIDVKGKGPMSTQILFGEAEESASG